ncbi:hypothetical protein pb186bvf_010266 [Paramecium bursaria]
MVYYLIGVTHKKTDQQVWADIERHVLNSGIGKSGRGQIHNSELARFKMGNLDQLMFINDNLIKQDTVVESLLKKIERQYLDVTEKLTYDFMIENRDGTQNIDKYINTFKWEDARFPRNQPLAEILKILQQRTAHVDSDLRQKVQSYQELKNQTQQLAKKEGNLLVRDLVDVLKEPIVKQRDFVYSEYLTTLVAIVPKNQVQDWLACYEFLHENVVPKTAKQFQVEDKDNLTIWRIVVMKSHLDKELEIEEPNPEGKPKKAKQTPVEEVIINAKEKLRITLKEFEYKPTESRDREKQRHELKSKSDNANAILKQACEKAYSDLYITYLHLKQLRLVVDVAMRFGTQDQTLTCIIRPEQGKEKKIQQSLLNLFADQSQVQLYGTKEELEDTEDFFPFVYVPINIP